MCDAICAQKSIPIIRVVVQREPVEHKEDAQPHFSSPVPQLLQRNYDIQVAYNRLTIIFDKNSSAIAYKWRKY